MDIFQGWDLKHVMMIYIILKVVSDFQQSLPEPNGNVFYNTFYKFFSLVVFDSKSFMGTLVNSKFSAAGLTAARIDKNSNSIAVSSSTSTISKSSDISTGISEKGAV